MLRPFVHLDECRRLARRREGRPVHILDAERFVLVIRVLEVFAEQLELTRLVGTDGLVPVTKGVDAHVPRHARFRDRAIGGEVLPSQHDLRNDGIAIHHIFHLVTEREPTMVVRGCDDDVQVQAHCRECGEFESGSLMPADCRVVHAVTLRGIPEECECDAVHRTAVPDGNVHGSDLLIGQGTPFRP